MAGMGTLQGFHETFKSHCEVVIRVGCPQVIDVILAAGAADQANPTAAECTSAFERIKAIRFIDGAGKQYKNYVTDLEHAMLEGEENYPTSLDYAFSILSRRKVEKVAPVIHEADAFATVEVTSDFIAADNGVVSSHFMKGHFADHCPTTTTENGECNISFALFSEAEAFCHPKVVDPHCQSVDAGFDMQQ